MIGGGIFPNHDDCAGKPGSSQIPLPRRSTAGTFRNNLVPVNTMIFFLSNGKHESHLADVAARVFEVLGVGQWEERQSTHCPPDELYFAGYKQNAFIKVYDCDDDRM